MGTFNHNCTTNEVSQYCYIFCWLLATGTSKWHSFRVVSFLQAVFSEPGHQFVYKLLSYYIVLFPAIDVISSYPLMNHVMSNNLYSFIAGQDSSKNPKYKFDWLLKVVLRFIAALLPILAAFGVANLIYVFRYAGLFGFLNLFSPILLQLRSIYVCKKKFSVLNSISLEGDSAMNHSNLENNIAVDQESREPSPTSSHQSCHESYSHSASGHSSRLGRRRFSDSEEELGWTLQEKEELESDTKERASYRTHHSNLGKELQQKEKRSGESDYSDSERELHQSILEEEEAEEKAKKEKGAKKKMPPTYMTPYSFVVLSHPVFVCVVGALGFILFMLAIASLFVQLEELTCEAL